MGGNLRGGAYFGAPEVEDDDIEGGEDDEDEVVFPLDASQSCWRGFDVDDCGEEGADDGPGHALGADVGWEDFTWCARLVFVFLC